MQKLQDSVFSIVKTSSLSPAVFSYLQPSDDFPDKTPLGGILNDTKHGWLALGPKFCVVDLRTGLKIAQRTFGTALSNFRTTVTSVVELPTPLADNTQQLIVSLECEDIAGMICIFHINGSQVLHCIQTDVVVTELAVCDGLPDGPFACFDGAVMAGTKTGEIFAFDLNRSGLIQALKDISQGYDHLVRSEENLASIMFLPLNALHQIDAQRDLALENDDHLAVLLNENSLADGQYVFRNPDGTVRMKARRDHIRVTVVEYIPQLGSLAVGFNFGAFQIWNLLNLDLEFTSQVNVECLPVTNFGFQEPCDDPRAFCYLWVVFSVIDHFDEEEFPLAVMYSLTYQGKRMLSDTKCLYQDFLTATVRFQVELGTMEEGSQLVGGRCVSCYTYSINSMLGAEGEDSMLNICQLVWECWGDGSNCPPQYGMLLFDLDQWYKDQMPATYPLQSNAFMSAYRCAELSRGASTLSVRLVPQSVAVYSAATRLEEHFYPNSLRYDLICLNTSEACVMSTTGIQRQIINSLDEVGPTALLNPTRLYHACIQTGLVPLYMDTSSSNDQEEQRRYLLSVALEARLSRLLKRCAHDWATGSHIGAGCTLTFLVDWCWKRAINLKENARELTAPLFTSSALPDRNVVRCLEHCVQQLIQLTQLLDAILTKCCNLVVPDALSSMEEKYKGVGCVSLYFQVVQWFVRVGLLPERHDAGVAGGAGAGGAALPYPAHTLYKTYTNRRVKLHRLQDHNMGEENAAIKSCPLLYIDQLIEQEFGGDRIHEMWIRGGSESNGLYPPPSLYSLLRLYLLPDIAEEHKHSLVLYLLVDYSMVYDEVRYEAVIRRLMQFPTMFGLSNTAIKATQAFWHLDHRDFDFALDQLQCLTGNTLSEWQHNVVLSSLLAQKKTQSALQYLHVRKPAPIQSTTDANTSKVNDHDKLEDWQSCCNLYLARGLVFEALDVIRMCVSNAGSLDNKAQVLNFFFKGCRNTGQLSKLLQVTLLPFEEEIFIRYFEDCNEMQTSDILIMYYLQQARYLEAEQYNNRIKRSKPRAKELTASVESLTDVTDRQTARDMLVEVACASLPAITGTVAHTVEKEFVPHIIAPKPMSVYIQAKSPKNMFTYKSSFIQDTIENASETWINKPKARKGLKRALNIEETPFICTPKLSRTKTIFSPEHLESTPSKRPRLDLAGTPRTPRTPYKNSEISHQMSILLEMPEAQSPDVKLYDRRGADTPHSILKIRENAVRDGTSPVDSRYLADSDDELLDTASNHTHYSDSTNKHLRFTIPTASESGSTPSPPTVSEATRETDIDHSLLKERDVDMTLESFTTTQSHPMHDSHPLESPPKKQATEEKVTRKSFKDTVKARRSFSISANSSLSEDPNTSIESIADIPITLINPRYSGEKRRTLQKDEAEAQQGEQRVEIKRETSKLEVPKTPKGRRSIRTITAESTPLINRSRSTTPERIDSPITPLHSVRNTRSRSRTPEISPRSSPLAPIPEQPKTEAASEPHPAHNTLSVSRAIRARSRTPERIEKVVESPRLEAITESPTKSSDSPSSSPTRRNLRSRSRTPEVEVPEKSVSQGNLSPRSLRSRAKTPEKLMSPKKDVQKSAKKPLSRLVLEANAIAASKQLEKQLEEEEKSDRSIGSTPMKNLKSVPSLMDVTISPIASKSILQSPNESVLSESVTKESMEDTVEMKSLPAFTMNETKFGKSVLHSYESSVTETTPEESSMKVETSVSKVEFKSLPAFSLSESLFEKSVLHSYESSVGEVSSLQGDDKPQDKDKEVELKHSPGTTMFNVSNIEKSVLASRDTTVDESHSKDPKHNVSSLMTSDSEIDEWKSEKRDKQDVIQKEKEKIVEIEREIHEIENEMSEEDDQSSGDGDEMVVDTGEEDIESSDEESDEDEEDLNDYDSNLNLLSVVHALMSEDSLNFSRARASSSSIISIVDSDESSSSNDNLLDIEEENSKESDTDQKIAQVSVEVEENSNTKSKTQETTDPLNQALVSLLTDDNSMRSDTSNTNLNYSEDKIDEVKQDDGLKESKATTGIKPSETLPKVVSSTVVEQQNPKTPIPEPMETANVIEKPQDVPMKTANVIEEPQDVPMKTANVIEKPQDVPMKTANVIEKPQDVPMKTANVIEKPQDVPMKTANVIEKPQDVPMKTANVIENPQDVPMKTANVIEKPQDVPMKTANVIEKPQDAPMKTANVIEKPQDVPMKTANVIEKPQDTPMVVDEGVTERATSEIKSSLTEKVDATSNVSENKTEQLPKIDVALDTREVSKVEKATEETKPTSRTRRTRSTTSNKSVETEQIETQVKPMTRRRSQSTTSNKSVTEEQKTPEKDPETPSRSRTKTPTSTEVRKIITRRASKELSEKMDKSETSIDTSIDVTTPRRRSTRSRSKIDDDNASVASESSVRSTRSKASEGAGDVKPKRGRKSVLPTKPDLSVIPESTVEELGSKLNSKDDIISDYSSNRRLTRNQKSVLESWLEPRGSPSPRPPRRRRPSATSRSSAISEHSHEDDDASSTSSAAFDVQPIDRISLLNKQDFEGSPDPSELQGNVSPPESIASDASKQRQQRLRASSESRSTPKAAKITRRVSVDVAESIECGSPSRGRRASFTRACEALHTPKGRRTSTDQRKGDTDSQAGSPAASPSDSSATVTPSRRGRRPSAHSDTSTSAKADTGRRTKKLSAIEEDKDTRKK